MSDISYAFDDDFDHRSLFIRNNAIKNRAFPFAISAAVLAGIVFLNGRTTGMCTWIPQLGMSTCFAYACLIFALVAGAFIGSSRVKNFALFVYACFFQTIDGNSQSDRLESFYKSQAHVYDQTRTNLLAGRKDMLRLVAGHVRHSLSKRKPSQKNVKDLIWVDIGGGTGWNIEQMNNFLPVSCFKKIYLVDLCSSLCETAKKRFQNLGWDNVIVLNEDASTFKIPEGESCADIITMSYSLSMIPNVFTTLDRAGDLLSKEGLFGIVDFGVSAKCDFNHKKHNWLTRWFWQIWFDFDHINLNDSRRGYVEHKFNRIKDFTGGNSFVLGIRLPYYIFIGESKLSAAESAFACEPWRLSYDDDAVSPWDTYMYAFAWEDPKEDLVSMNLGPSDNVLAITSGGCNLLEYTLQGVRNAWSVDMNPAQNHLFELKLAAIKCPEITYDDFWKMFGDGIHEDFSEILDLRLSPYLSRGAYRFWKNNVNSFEKKGLYFTGHSGVALSFVRFMIHLFRIEKSIEKMLHAKTADECNTVWETEVKPVLFPKWAVNFILSHKAFFWKCLGVPMKQMKMVMEACDGELESYLNDTFDPISKRGVLSEENYFYYVSLRGRYHRDICPTYLKKEAFSKLRSENARLLDSVRINTKKYVDVLRSPGPNGEKFTKIVLMDHMDWFDASLAQEEINALWDAVADGGKVFWRSAGRLPWYNELFEDRGFQVEQAHVRHSGKFIDRVNMYASFNVATKPVSDS